MCMFYANYIVHEDGKDNACDARDHLSRWCSVYQATQEKERANARLSGNNGALS